MNPDGGKKQQRREKNQEKESAFHACL